MTILIWAGVVYLAALALAIRLFLHAPKDDGE